MKNIPSNLNRTILTLTALLSFGVFAQNASLKIEKLETGKSEASVKGTITLNGKTSVLDLSVPKSKLDYTHPYYEITDEVLDSKINIRVSSVLATVETGEERVVGIASTIQKVTTRKVVPYVEIDLKDCNDKYTRLTQFVTTGNERVSHIIQKPVVKEIKPAVQNLKYPAH